MLAELKELVQYRQRYFQDAAGGAPKLLALRLSSRKNLYLYPWVAGGWPGAACAWPRPCPRPRLPCSPIASGVAALLPSPLAPPHRRHAAGPAPSSRATCGAEEGSRESVDAKCMRLTTPWVRERAGQDPDIETCGFYEGLEGAGPEGRLGAGAAGGGRPRLAAAAWRCPLPRWAAWGAVERGRMRGGVLLPPAHGRVAPTPAHAPGCLCPPRAPAGVHTLHDRRVWGRKHQWCPYFLACRMLAYSNVVMYNCQYMIEPRWAAGLVGWWGGRGWWCWCWWCAVCNACACVCVWCLKVVQEPGRHGVPSTPPAGPLCLRHVPSCRRCPLPCPPPPSLFPPSGVTDGERRV